MTTTNMAARIAAKKAQLDRLRPFPEAAVARLKKNLALEWIYNSNAIEGNTLSKRETELILEQGATFGNKTVREHYEVINHQDAIRLAETLSVQDIMITAAHVRQLHARLLAKIDDQRAGQYRVLPVQKPVTANEPPYGWQVPAEMDGWAHWLRQQEFAMEPVELAAVAHHKLIAIHPFNEGNGRVSRLVMNLILMRAGFPPAIIGSGERRSYFRALGQADKGNPSLLINLVGRALEHTLTRYLDACTPEAPAPDQEWLSLREAAEMTGYSATYLSQLARSGRIEAIKRGRLWYTTLQAVKAYAAEQGFTGS